MSRVPIVRWQVLYALAGAVFLAMLAQGVVAGMLPLGAGLAVGLILLGASLAQLRRERKREQEQRQILMVPGAAKCVIHLLDSDGRRLYPRHSSQPDWRHALGMPAGKGIAGQALKTLTTQVIDDVRESPDFLPLRSSGELRSLLVAPLHAHGTPLGTISLNSSMAKAFTEQDKQLVAILAAQASVALFQSQLHQAAETERHHVETLLNNLGDGLLVLDIDNRILRYNFFIAHLLGVGDDELLGERVDGNSDRPALRRLADLVD